MKRRLTIVFFDAGGGHRSAAEALKSVLESQDRPWQVQLLNLQQELDKLDVLRKLTRIRIQDGYNLMLRRGWTRLAPALLPLLQATIRLYHRAVVRLLTAYWKQNPTDLVLSVIPHFNRAIAESVPRAECAPPFVTLLTDLADYPPHFWMERESEYLICGTARAEEQAYGLGHDEDHVFLASGMVLRSKFYEQPSFDREKQRERLGLDRFLPTGLLLFGGYGSRAMLEIVRRLNAGSNQVQLMVMCGRNARLQAEIKNLKTRFPMVVEGFTQEIDGYMALADFFIGKPGPGSISEALAFNLPVIVECNARTLPQERYNAQWIEENGVGLVVKDFRKIDGTIAQLLEPQKFKELRNNAANYRNRALFEIPVFLEQIFERRKPAKSALGAPARAPSMLEQAAWASLIARLESSHT